MLNQGDKAPNFTAKNQNGEEVSLNDFKGKKVVLYFYPKDMTPGCTTESCNLRDNYSELQKAGYEVIGVSNDDVESHAHFAGKHSLPFTLVADTDKKIVNDYGVYGEKNLYGNKSMGIKRTTFVIDEEGTIQRVIKRVKNAEAAEQILKG